MQRNRFLFYCYFPLSYLLNCINACNIIIALMCRMLVTGSVPGKIVVRRTHDLSVVHRFPIDAAVECVVLIEPDNYVMVGLRDGKLLLLTHKSR